MLQATGFIKINQEDCICYDSPDIIYNVSAVFENSWKLKLRVYLHHNGNMIQGVDFELATAELGDVEVNDLLYNPEVLASATKTWLINRLKLYSPQETTII